MEAGVEEASKFLSMHDGSMQAVFTAKGRSVAILFAADRRCLIPDSHAHGRRGGLLALCQDVAGAFSFLCDSVLGGLSLQRGAAITFLFFEILVKFSCSTLLHNISSKNFYLLP